MGSCCPGVCDKSKCADGEAAACKGDCPDAGRPEKVPCGRGPRGWCADLKEVHYPNGGLKRCCVWVSAPIQSQMSWLGLRAFGDCLSFNLCSCKNTFFVLVCQFGGREGQHSFRMAEDAWFVRSTGLASRPSCHARWRAGTMFHVAILALVPHPLLKCRITPHSGGL